MFIEKVTISRVKKNGEQSRQCTVLYRFECDECGKIYEKRPCVTHLSKSGLHFCSNVCKFNSHKIGGKLKLICDETSLERYGDTSPMRTAEVQQRLAQSFEERYGSGITCPLQIPAVKERRRRTHLERYGAEETFQSEGPKAKRRATWMKNYGVPYKPFEEYAAERSRQSMLKMPQKWSSKGEEEMCKLLHERFGEVIRQKHVHKWPIDAYIPAIDTYVQFDGVYWHGLDRPIESIERSTRPRDKVIYRRWLSDHAQNEWFAKHDLRLVRITDVEFKKNGIDKIVSILT